MVGRPSRAGQDLPHPIVCTHARGAKSRCGAPRYRLVCTFAIKSRNANRGTTEQPHPSNKRRGDFDHYDCPRLLHCRTPAASYDRLCEASSAPDRAAAQEERQGVYRERKPLRMFLGRQPGRLDGQVHLAIRQGCADGQQRGAFAPLRNPCFCVHSHSRATFVHAYARVSCAPACGGQVLKWPCLPGCRFVFPSRQQQVP